jgi:translation initiation factor eIF-2B subunit epsilon
MPPKGKKSQSNDKAKATEEERDEPLQAVVRAANARLCILVQIAKVLQILADPFETRFNPFTLERPRVCPFSLL